MPPEGCNERESKLWCISKASIVVPMIQRSELSKAIETAIPVTARSKLLATTKKKEVVLYQRR